MTAPLAVVSGWLDDPTHDRAGSGSPPERKSTHNGQVKPWACGPLRTVTPGAGGETAAITIQVRLLSEGLEGRLLAATRPGRSVRLGGQHYEIPAPARPV